MSIADDILANIDIVEIIEKYINLKKVWRNYSWLCPFHNEKTPSFTVSHDKQIFKCFWCGIWWNAIKFVMEYEKIDFWDCIKQLAPMANIDITKYQHDPKSINKNSSEKEKIKLINKYTCTFFQEKLQNSKSSLEYLTDNRKIDKLVIDKFKIWYAPDSHYELINYLKWKWFDYLDIQKVWLCNKWKSWDYYSFFRNRIMFPIVDQVWNIISFAWRALSNKDTPKYLNIPETPLYDKSRTLYGINFLKENIKTFDKVYVVEWYMDVIALYRAWISVGVATCWTALTAQHVKILKRYSQNIIFSFDNDDAGFSATLRWLKMCFEQDVFPKVLILEKFKDLDEYINEWNDILDLKEVDGFEFVINKLNSKFNISSPVERKKFINEMFDLISHIKDSDILDFYLEILGTKLGKNSVILFWQLKTFIKSKAINRHNEKISENTQYPNKSNDEKYSLWSLFYEDFMSKNWLNDLIILEYSQLLIEYIKYFPDSLLNKILKWEIDENDKQLLLESQLKWEKDFEWLTNNKKIEILLLFLKQSLNKYMRNKTISKSIPDEKKQEFYKKLQDLNKK